MNLDASVPNVAAAQSNVHGPHFHTGKQRDQPFQARWVAAPLEDSPTEMLQQGGRIARDSQGRTRNEIEIAGHAVAVVITDYVAGASYVLDLAERAYHVISFDPDVPEPSVTAPPDRPQETVEAFACFRLDAPSGSKFWVSEELRHSLREQYSFYGRDYEWRLFDIQLQEPDPELFRVPTDYRKRSESCG